MAKWNVKQLTRVHKKFASERLGSKAEAKADETIAEHPELEGIRDVLVAQFSSDEDTAILGSPLDICEFFAAEKRTEGMEFSVPHTKSVTRTLSANFAAYRNFKQLLKEEPSDDYKKFYDKLIKDFDEYFVLASEDMLCDYFTGYREFRDAFIEEENARYKATAAKRKGNQAAEKNKDAE